MVGMVTWCVVGKISEGLQFHWVCGVFSTWPDVVSIWFLLRVGRAVDAPAVQDDADGKLPPLSQAALGLMPVCAPAKEDSALEKLQRRIELLEQQVQQLQNRNQALEESHKRLSDLVEAQNHLLVSSGPLEKRSTYSNPGTNSHEALDEIEKEEPQVSPVEKRSADFPAAYELPRRVSAKEVLSLWDYGNEDFPPLKDWTPTQKLKQQSKISRWKKLVDIFKHDYKGDLKKFESHFSDSRGELLPVTTILSLYETQQTPAFLSPTPEKRENDENHTQHFGERNEEATRDIKVALTDAVTSSSASEVRYTLPRKVTPKDIVYLWENGCEHFPPVSQWSRAQKIGQETKVFRWRKIVEVFVQDCNRNWEEFDKKYTGENGNYMAISAIILKYDTEHAVQGPIFDKEMPRIRLPASEGSTTPSRSTFGDASTDESVPNGVTVKVETSTQNLVEVPLEHEKPQEDELRGAPLESPLTAPSFVFMSPLSSESLKPEGCFSLPRKASAIDIIKMWEEGYGDMQPLSCWTTAQKAGQRSKFSRWAKIYDIYKYHCKGDLKEFQAKFSDERGELYPVTTIVAMHDARGPGNGTPQDSELYHLPRKVTAKDVVTLWEEGCELFPPVSKWPKVHKIGQATKLFRWKKIVDIFRRDCQGSWDMFDARFSNSKGEVLPISGILAKYDMENDASSMFKGIGSLLKDAHAPNPKDVPTISGSDSRSSRLTENESPSPKKSDFILPNNVSALDVIYLWENGLGDMPPIFQWTAAQKATQRSKISRWNKIVDIFKYECEGDVRKFEEKYKDERGELLPITTILSIHDSYEAWARQDGRPEPCVYKW